LGWEKRIGFEGGLGRKKEKLRLGRKSRLVKKLIPDTNFLFRKKVYEKVRSEALEISKIEVHTPKIKG
jgi:hypothetical protein